MAYPDLELRRGGGEVVLFYLPCRFFFLLWFLLVLPKIRWGGHAPRAAPLPRSATASYIHMQERMNKVTLKQKSEIISWRMNLKMLTVFLMIWVPSTVSFLLFLNLYLTNSWNENTIHIRETEMSSDVRRSYVSGGQSNKSFLAGHPPYCEVNGGKKSN